MPYMLNSVQCPFPEHSISTPTELHYAHQSAALTFDLILNSKKKKSQIKSNYVYFTIFSFTVKLLKTRAGVSHQKSTMKNEDQLLLEGFQCGTSVQEVLSFTPCS